VKLHHVLENNVCTNPAPWEEAFWFAEKAFQFAAKLCHKPSLEKRSERQRHFLRCIPYLNNYILEQYSTSSWNSHI